MKYLFNVILVCVALSGCMTVSGAAGVSDSVVAASPATLDTVYRYKIINQKSGLVLGIASPQFTAGTAALQWADNGSADHLWHFIPDGAGYYKTINMNSGQILGISAGSISTGASVLQWADNGTNDHLWKFMSNGSGLYEIQNYSGLALDVAGGSLLNGAAIVQDAYTGAASQLWKLVSTGVVAYSAPASVHGSITVHDPSMIKSLDGSTYYVFSTSLATPSYGIEVHASSDRSNFTYAGPAFSRLPAWINTYNGGNNGMWAPDVSYHNGKYWLYYAVSSFGSQVSAIGLATSSTAAPGSWIDQGPIFISSTGLPYNAIDPGLIVDGAGAWWLSFGSYWNGIYMIQIDPSTGKQLNSNLSHLAKRLDISKGLEGASIYPYGGYYYLFASVDLCCSATATYHIIVGRSSRVTGPYRDEGGVDLLNGGGTIVLSAHGNSVGPGGESLLTDTSGTWLVYHYYDSNNTGSPTLGMNLLGWSSSGWPYVR